MTEKELIGKKITAININGFEVEIIVEDGTTLNYQASDGGYSNWEISNPK